MKNYILLAEICFDWSGGEYNNKYIDDIYLGNGYFDNDKLAKVKADRLLKEYCDNMYDALDYESSTKVIQI